MSLRWVIPALVLVALACAPPAGAIVAGSQVPITAHPHQVRVVMTAPSDTYSCGGVIVDASHIVTAAHCAYIDDTLLAPSKFAVGYGSANRNTLTSAGVVSEVTIPNAYLTDITYDVALLTLAAPLPIPSATAKAIPLAPAATLAAAAVAEDNAFATGWGNLTYQGSQPSNLQGVALPLRADSVCENFVFPDDIGPYVAARNVCAGGLDVNDPAADTCQGDSGGPLALDDGGTPELVALTSRGYGCGEPGTPAYYTETSDPEIRAVIDGSAPPSSTLRGSEWSPPRNGGSGAPSVTIPAPAPPIPGVATRDTTRPTAKVAKLSCTRKRKCSFKVSTADKGGTIKKFSATVTRKVRKCRQRGDFRVCSTTTRKKTLKPKRVSGGFTFSATLVKASYKLTAVATDAAGNRSKALTKTFRVR